MREVHGKDMDPTYRGLCSSVSTDTSTMQLSLLSVLLYFLLLFLELK